MSRAASAGAAIAPAPAEVSVELEHAIGFAGAVYDGVHVHPNGKEFVYVAGACVGAFNGRCGRIAQFPVVTACAWCHEATPPAECVLHLL